MKHKEKKSQQKDPYKIISYNIYDDGEILKSKFNIEGYNQDRKEIAKLLMHASFATVSLMRNFKVSKEAYLKNISLLWDSIDKSEKQTKKQKGDK